MCHFNTVKRSVAFSLRVDSVPNWEKLWSVFDRLVEEFSKKIK